MCTNMELNSTLVVSIINVANGLWDKKRQLH